MDLAASTLWWLVFGVLVAAELATGTFYLLMLALGAVAGALGAHAGLSVVAQMVAAALLGGGAVVAWTVKRGRRPTGPANEANPDLHLDIGGRVHVGRWHADGTARVSYRGSDWDVRHVGSGLAMPGDHVIRAVEGNRLLVERAAP